MGDLVAHDNLTVLAQLSFVAPLELRDRHFPAAPVRAFHQPTNSLIIDST